MSAELFFLCLYTNVSLFYPTILHQKTIIRNPTQNASEADFHHFLRTRKNIEMVQTKHCDD